MSILSKLLEIQTKLKAPKEKYNKFGEYNYRSLEGIMEAIKPFESTLSCILTLNDEIVRIGESNYIEASATLTDVETGESITTKAYARESEEKKKLDASQLTGVASSYARKYACNGLLALDDTKDADTDEFNKESQSRSNNSKKNTDDKKEIENSLNGFQNTLDKIGAEQNKPVSDKTLSDLTMLLFEIQQPEKAVCDAYKINDIKELTERQAQYVINKCKRAKEEKKC